MASSTSSMVRQGLRGLINSVLYRPLIVSANALSTADRPDRWVNARFGEAFSEPDRCVLTPDPYGEQRFSNS